MNISKWALDNRNLVNFLVFCLMAGGVIAYTSMSKLEDPEIKVRQAMVSGCISPPGRAGGD